MGGVWLCREPVKWHCNRVLVKRGCEVGEGKSMGKEEGTGLEGKREGYRGLG